MRWVPTGKVRIQRIFISSLDFSYINGAKNLITLTIQRLINGWNLRQSSIGNQLRDDLSFRKSSCSCWPPAFSHPGRTSIFFKSNKSWKKNYWVCGFNTYFQYSKRLSFLIGCLSEYPQGFHGLFFLKRFHQVFPLSHSVPVSLFYVTRNRIVHHHFFHFTCLLKLS